jgi:DNA polymerase III delta subunit
VWGDDDVARVREAMEAMASRGLFGGSAVVVVRRADAMRGAVEALVESVLAEDRFEGRLVLVAASLDRRKRWVGAAAKGVEVECAPLADAGEVRRWVERMAQDRAVRIAPDAAAELLDRCGFDLALLDGEVEKLTVAAAAGSIDRALVARLVASVRAHAIEELSDRIGRGDVGGSLRAVRALRADDEPPLRITAFLASNLRRALHVAEEQERGGDTDAIAQRLGMPVWLVRRQLGRGPASRLERGLAVLAGLDQQLKRSRPEDVVLEDAIRALATKPAR